MGSAANEFTRQIQELGRQKDAAYAERNKLVALAAKMAIALGFRAGLGQHDPNDSQWDADWRTIVYIDLPEGQCSWHIHDSERVLFESLPIYEGQWDGHSTEEKYERIDRTDFQRKSKKLP